MSEVYKLSFAVKSEVAAEILIALLSDMKFYAFEQVEDFLYGYISVLDFEDENIEVDLKAKNIIFEIKRIKEKNWNEEWERNFQPVIIHDFVAIRASFHIPIPDVEFDIVITPKMSFGTGHHPTTFLMVEAMRSLKFAGANVFDFGTGTGVLAILAEKLGGKVNAIDIDEWSITNALENAAMNDCKDVKINKSEVPPTDQSFDIILANINTHVLIDNLLNLTNICKVGGRILLSGFLDQDCLNITDLYEKRGFALENILKREGWNCILMKKITV